MAVLAGLQQADKDRGQNSQMARHLFGVIE